MARPRKTSANLKRKISKEERAQRQAAEEKIKVKTDQLLTPPERLTERARQEFLRVVEESKELEVLDNLDLTFLIIYAEAWDA